MLTEDELSVSLVDGRRGSVPLIWYPRRFHATQADRRMDTPVHSRTAANRDKSVPTPVKKASFHPRVASSTVYPK
ncbi:hypothetical protein ACWPKS_14355 [Coraliomargarita sp. W4R72]